MNGFRFVTRSLRHHWRMNVAVALGVLAATAVLTGALLVGDSVRGSLRDLTLDRLGEIDEVLVSDRYFRAGLAQEIGNDADVANLFQAVVPAILVPQATVEHRAADRVQRSSQVLLVGADARFWAMGTEGSAPDPLPRGREIVLNEPLAADLGVERGDRVVVRLGGAQDVPAESPLGRTSGQIRNLAQLTVADIIPASGLGRFNLRASQSLPRNAFVPIELVQQALDEPNRVNALLVGDDQPTAESTSAASAALDHALRPTLDDYGFRINRVRHTFEGEDGEQEILDYFNVTTDRMMFSPAAAEAAQEAFAPYDAQPLLTYVANRIVVAAAGEESDSSPIPYSIVTALEPQADIGPLINEAGEPIELAPNEIALNSWAAEDLDVEPGATIRLHYYAPETTHGEFEELSAEFQLAAVLPLTEPFAGPTRNEPARYDEPPTVANDPQMTPEVEGVTDQQTIDDWDAPFPMDNSLIRSQDEQYWELHRTTPKAFISLATGTRLWGSRFGSVTSFRIPTPERITSETEAETFEKELREAFRDALLERRTALGFEFVPVKRQGLAAAQGTTPFDVLFLSLSFFIIAAALILVALLFRLGIEQRSAELGALLAVGLQRRQTVRLMVAEGAIVAAVGAFAGVPVGIGYAWLMLTGLRTWWLDAVQTPFLQLHIGWLSLVIGYVAGLLICVLTIAWSIRQTRKISVRRLLGGPPWRSPQQANRPRRWMTAVAAVCFVAATGLAIVAAMGGAMQAAAFAGAGAAVLTGALIVIWARFQSGPVQATIQGSYPLLRLAGRNAQRNPGRSTMTIALMAVASFLIIAMSAFQLAPTEQGTAGFDLIAESAEPVYENLDSSEGRRELFGSRAQALNGVDVLAFRVKAGDDASCRNLYRPQSPRILGVTPEIVEHFDDAEATSFAWSSTAATSEAETKNPWRLLGTAVPTPGEAVPVVIDKNTAMYSLKLYRGIGEEFDIQYEDGTDVRFRVAGLLANSILQGGLLVGEADLLARFPDISGYRYFLIDTHQGRQRETVELLEDRLSDQGFDAVPARQVLAELLAVQNTYLSTFQSLGALGLLLGTFGLATVQLRNVLERRGELAVLRAAGFRRRRLAGMVLLENVLLLLAGLATGAGAALLVVLPHMWFGGASVPLLTLLVMLVAIFTAGVVTGLAAVRATLKAPLILALRGQ